MTITDESNECCDSCKCNSAVESNKTLVSDKENKPLSKPRKWRKLVHQNN